MKTFYQFLENINSSLVSININNYKKQAERKAKDTLDYAISSKEELVNNFKLDINLVRNGLKDFPLINQLVSSLLIKDKNWIRDEKDPAVKQLHSWYAEKTKDKEFDERQLIFKAIMHIYDYYESMDKTPIDEKKYLGPVEKSVEVTMHNMQVIKKRIEEAIRNLNWNGSKVTITPDLPDVEAGEDHLAPATDADIMVGNKRAIFTYWNMEQSEKMNSSEEEKIENRGKIQIEDIIEFDDDDFMDYFSNEQEKQDYFNLISQLQNPNKKDQILTLYTARPAKDREFYSKTEYLPSGIFLSNSFNHVDGLASDLSSDKRRDIYKVKINSRYLIKTLDGPVRYYQVIKDSPVEYICLY
jgi:hypothetical protein